MSPNDSTDEYFCYFYIRLIPTAILGFAEISIIGIMLLTMAIIQYRKILRITRMGRNLMLLYVSIFAQCISISVVYIVYTLRVSFLEAIYWVFREQEHSPEQNLKMSKLSKYTFAVDIVGIYAIQSVLILVCYNWYLLCNLRMDKTV